MFRKDYENTVDSIKPDGYIKQKVLKKIETETEKKPKTKGFYRAVAAVAACAVIAMTVHTVNKFNKPLQYFEAVNAKTYDDVYDVVKEIKAKAIFTNTTNAIRDFGEDIIMYSAKSSDNAGVPESATGAVTTEDSDTGYSENESYSETNTQVEGVDESDIVKTDGEYIYSITQDTGILRIIKAGKEPRLLSKTKLEYDYFSLTGSMYLYKDLLVVIASNYRENISTVAMIYDVSKPEAPEKLYECKQSGHYNTSRLIGDKLYLISNYSVVLNDIAKNEPETYVPYIECDGKKDIAPADCITISSVRNSAEYTVICGFDVTKGDLVGTQSMLGGTYSLYCSTENIITAGYTDGNKTPVTRYSIKDGMVEYKASGSVNGNLLNQFSIDEHKGNFRFVTTYTEGKETRQNGVVSYDMTTKNALYVLNGELKQIGAITDIAPGERVYSVRFMGDTAYFVTFRQVDPLFSVDLSDPENPKIIGALKIPGFSNYLFPYGEGKLLGIGQDADEYTGRTGGVKLSMFDISDPSNVTESDKLILDANYSPALYDHKASLIDYKKNLIGFSVYAERGLEYRIFRLTDNGFEQIRQIILGSVDDYVRGIYINDEFYIITNQKLYVYSISDFSQIADLVLL